MAKKIKQRDINLLAAMDRSGSDGSILEKRPARYIVPGVILMTIATIIVLYFAQTADLIQEKNKLNRWLETPETKTAFEKATRLRDEAAEATQKVALADKLIRSLSACPDLKGDDILSIYKMAGDAIEIFGFRYDRADRILTLNAQCKNPARAPIFVAKLRADGPFENISYSGYTGSEFVTQGTPQVDAETGDVSPGYITNQVYLFTVIGIVGKTKSGSGSRSSEGSGAGSGAGLDQKPDRSRVQDRDP
jgi:hypothetical protein